MMQEWLIYGGSMKCCIVLRKHKKFKSAVGPSSILSSKLGAEQEGECWDTMVSSHCTLRTQRSGQPIKSWGWINEEMQSHRTMYSNIPHNSSTQRCMQWRNSVVLDTITRKVHFKLYYSVINICIISFNKGIGHPKMTIRSPFSHPQTFFQT